MKDLGPFKYLQNRLDRLKEALNDNDLPQKYVVDVVVQRFEFSIELFWKVLKRILLIEKIDVVTPRQIMQQAYQARIIEDEQIWLSMLDARNATSHIYGEDEAYKIYVNVRDDYYSVMRKTYDKLVQKYS